MTETQESSFTTSDPALKPHSRSHKNNTSDFPTATINEIISEVGEEAQFRAATEINTEAFMERTFKLPVPLPLGWKILTNFSYEKNDEYETNLPLHFEKDLPVAIVDASRKNWDNNQGLWCTDLSTRPPKDPESITVSNATESGIITYVLVPDIFGRLGQQDEGQQNNYARLEATYGSKEMKLIKDFIYRINIVPNDPSTPELIIGFPVIPNGTRLLQLAEDTSDNRNKLITHKRRIYIPEIVADLYFNEAIEMQPAITTTLE